MTKKPEKQPATPVLSRDDIIGKLKNDTVTVEIPGWGGSIRIRPPTYPAMCQIRAEAPNDAEFKASLAIACCVDLKPEDMRVMREGNGIRFAELSNAIYAALGATGAPGN